MIEATLLGSRPALTQASMTSVTWAMAKAISRTGVAPASATSYPWSIAIKVAGTFSMCHLIVSTLSFKAFSGG